MRIPILRLSLDDWFNRPLHSETQDEISRRTGLPQPMEPTKQTSDENTHTMIIEVINKMGIHARPAARIVRLANKYKSEVYVERDKDLINGKSIMGLMMLAAGKGSRLKFIASGEDGAELLSEMNSLFQRKFDEV